MSDLSEVEQAIVSTVTQIVYPNGTGAPSIVNAACKVFRGWPIPANLESDLAAGKVNISVYPTDIEQITTRYSRDWHELPIVSPTLALTTGIGTVTVGGSVSSPLNAAVLVNGTAYIYPVQAADTLTTIATALAALISADIPATNVGPVITITGATTLAARVGTLGTVVQEIGRQKRGFQITFWCFSPSVRDALVKACDPALRKLTFLSLPDGSTGRILYQRSPVSDRTERSGLYRRDLMFTVEYPTTDSQSAPQIVAQPINLADWFGVTMPPPEVMTYMIFENASVGLFQDGNLIRIN